MITDIRGEKSNEIDEEVIEENEVLSKKTMMRVFSFDAPKVEPRIK